MANTYKFIFAFCNFCFFTAQNHGIAQCFLPMAETCNEANLLCALDELNGLACSNTSTLASGCNPVCSQGGLAENTNWWGFMGNGASVSVTLSVGSCSNNQGLEFGLLRGCNCSTPAGCKSAPCVAPGTSQTLNVNLQKCVKYYLWVDGCIGDVCDFTISTVGGTVAPLVPLGYVNNDPDRVIDACLGYCNYRFFVQNQNDGCFIRYYWTLDGTHIGSEQEQFLDLSKEGDFEICVTQHLINPDDFNMVCNQQGPQCATLKIRKSPDRMGLPRKICWEAANPKGYKWFNRTIYESGEYRATIQDANCCLFDSIVQFNVIEKPEPEIVYYLSCSNQPYIDKLGRKHFPCLDKQEIVIPKTSNPYKCDESIILTAIHVDFAPAWSVLCANGMVELQPNIRILKPCDAGETYEYDYSWYSKKDTTMIISKNERLLVQAISNEYILKVDVIASIGSEASICSKTFYESIDEGDITPDCFPVSGTKVYCFEPVGQYWIEGDIKVPVSFFTWTVSNGQIISNPDSQSVVVAWNLNAGDTGRICGAYQVECGMSCEKCIDVFLETKIAGEDFAHRGLETYLDAKAHPNGIWRLISGPTQVHLFEPFNPRTKVSAFNYGTYCFEWSVTTNNCVLKDTLCVDFYFARRASPDYPRNDFDRRARMRDSLRTPYLQLFTPSLITAKGRSFVSFTGKSNAELQYQWYDLFGKLVLMGYLDSGDVIRHTEIFSPEKSGIYMLQLKLDGFTAVQKVCVLD